MLRKELLALALLGGLALRARAEEEVVVESVHFPVLSIAPGEGTREAVLEYGSAEGIVLGWRGDLFSRYEDGGRDHGRIGHAEIVAVEEHRSRARLTFLGEDTGREGDVVRIGARVPLLPSRSILWSLARKAVVFTRNDKSQKLLTYKDLYRAETATSLDEFVREALKEMHAVAPRAAHLAAPTRGRYKGRTCADVLAKAGPEDVLAFLDYVASFAGKYVGWDYRVSESFVAWVGDGAPHGGLLFLAKVRELASPEERAAYLRGLAPEIEGSITPDDMVDSWRVRATELSETGRRDEAVAVCDLAIEADRALGLDRDLPKSLFQRAYVLGAANRHVDARRAYAEAVAAFRALPEPDDDAALHIAYSIHNAAVEAWEMGLYAEALEGFREAVPLYEAADAPQADVGRIHRSIGDVLRDMGSYEEAIRSYELAANIFALLQEHGRLQEALLRMAKVHAKRGASAEAAETYERVLAAFRRVNDRAGETRALLDLADHHRGLGEYRQAVAACETAEKIWRELGDQKELSLTLVTLGGLRASLGDLAGAEKAQEEALLLRRRLKDRAGEAESLKELAALRVRRGDFRKGLATYEEARSLCAADGDSPAECGILDSMVSLLWERSEFEEALRLEERLVGLWRRSGAQADLAYALLARCGLCANLRDLEGADRDLAEALKLFRSIEHRIGEGQALQLSGSLRAIAREWTEARRLVDEAFAIFREAGNKSLEGEAARTLGDLWGGEYRFAEAREWYDRALAIFEHEDLNDPAEIAKTRMACARTLSLEGNLEEALRLQREALASAERAGEALVVPALNAIGETLTDLGRLAEARETYDRSQALVDRIDNDWLRGSLLWSRALLHVRMGETGKAIECDDAAIELWRRLRNEWGEAAVLLNRASHYLRRGDLEHAAKDLADGRPIAERTRDQRLLAAYLSARAQACVDRKDYAAAIPSLNEALLLSRAMRNKPFVQAELVQLAVAQRKLAEQDGSRERLDQAGAALAEALRLAREMKSPIDEGETVAETGNLALVRGDAPKARELLRAARAILEGTGERHTLAQTLYDLSRAEEEMKDLASAAATRRASIAVYQEIRAALGGGEAAEEKFLRSKIEVYESMASLLGRLIREEKDVAKRRLLVDDALGFVARARFEVLRREVSGTGSAELDRLLDEIRKAEADLARLEEERREALETGNRAKAERISSVIARKEEELGRLYRQRKGTDEEMDEQMRFDPRAIDLTCAPPEARLLLYFPGPKSLQIFVFSREGFLVWKEYPISRAELYGLVHRHGDLIGEMIGHVRRRDAMGVGFGPEAEASEKNPAWYRENIRALRETLKELHGHLIAPVTAEIGTADLLLVLPYGQLNYLPFEALVDETGGFLGARKRLVYFVHDRNMMTTLERLGSPAERREALWVGYADPCGKLKDALEEAAEVERLFPHHEVHTQETKTATEAQLEKTPEQCTILHFATHGYLNRTGGGAGEGGIPEPFLELASGAGSGDDDGRLEAGEVWARFKRKVPCVRSRTLRLVVLSACDTARAQDDPRAEVLGLPEAFVTAGAPAVVASLWSVYSWTTTDLMVEFYREVAKGSDLASAMREARRALIGKKEGIYAHPFYWAPFLLFGDWR